MQILIELDADTMRRLERVAPAKSRKRSAFIRAAIQKHLWELEEERTREAYLADSGEEPAFDAGSWEPLPYGGFDAPATDKKRRSTKATAKKRRAAK
jgi:predicted transcriptional regulator